MKRLAWVVRWVQIEVGLRIFDLNGWCFWRRLGFRCRLRIWILPLFGCSRVWRCGIIWRLFLGFLGCVWRWVRWWWRWFFCYSSEFRSRMARFGLRGSFRFMFSLSLLPLCLLRCIARLKINRFLLSAHCVLYHRLWKVFTFVNTVPLLSMHLNIHKMILLSETIWYTSSIEHTNHI